VFLARFSLRRPVALAMILAIVLILGGISLLRLPLDFLPHAEMPFIGVLIPYPAASPEQIEREVVRPIEEILTTLGGVREIHSYSDPDQAWVGVRFDWGREVNVLRLEVKEKIDLIRDQLPPDLDQILLLTFDTSDIPIIEGRISARGRDLSSSWDLLDQKIVRPLQRIPGVGRVNIDGVLPTQASIYLDLERLLAHDVDVARLFDELAAANVELTVGRITERGLRYDLRAVSGLHRAEDLAALPVAGSGLRLADVAEVVYGAPELSYGRRLNGEPAVAFWIQKASGHNTVEVCRQIEQELERINLDPALQGISSFAFFNQAEQITDSLDSLLQAGAIGSLLAVLMLYLFLRRVSMTCVVATAIPLSLLATLVFLYLTGRSLNVLSMMGLMLGVGMLVDNAVVVLEAIQRRRELGAPPVGAVIRGTREVGRAIVASTLTTVIVFAPIIVGKDDEIGVWLSEVGAAIGATLVLSLLVSLTVIPAMAVRVAGRQAVPGAGPVPGSVDRTGEARWLSGLRRRYLSVLGWTALRHPVLTGLVLVPAVLTATGLLMGVTHFRPEPLGEEGIRRERLYLDLEFSEPTDKEKASQAVLAVEEYIATRRNELGLRDVYSFFTADEAGISLFFQRGVLSEEMYRRVREDLRANLPVQAGVKYRFGDEEGEGSGAKTFTVTLWGEDTEVLARLGEEAARRLSALDGVADVRNEAEGARPEVRVRVDREQGGRFGVRPADVSQVLGLTYKGVELPRLRTSTQEMNLVVQLRPEDRESLENLSLLSVGERAGRPVRLGQVAEVELGRAPQRIHRVDRKTSLTIRGTHEGERFEAGLRDVRQVMENLALPLGYGWDFGAEIRRGQERNSEMGVNMLLALACVFFVMASLFESLLLPLVVIGCVPFASLGVFWVMMASSTPFNLMAMIGIVILIGIVVNNGIVLLDHINNHRRAGGSLDQAILTGCGDRLRPILMTASTTVLGLLPLALSTSAHVADAQYYPLARAVAGGLTSSTLLTLLVMPTYYRLAVRWIDGLRGTLAARGAGPSGKGTDTGDVPGPAGEQAVETEFARPPRP
jgi:HAE1 family hydrophobic/amphiphilic exporter-1